MRDDFGSAGFVIAVLSVTGWLTVVGGVVLAFKAVSDTATFNAAIPDIMFGAAISVGGFMQIASALVTKAVIVAAGNSGKMVRMMERLVAQTSEAKPDKLAGGAVQGTLVKRYKGQDIVHDQHGVRIDGAGYFPNVIEAERFIDGR